MATTQLKIGGMHCDACVRRVRTALGKMQGVEGAEVSVGDAAVRYDPAQVTPQQLAATVDGLGFTAEAQPA